MENVEKVVDEISIPEASTKTLQELAQQINTLQGYVRVIGDTLVNVAGVRGNYQFNKDFTKIIKGE